MAKVFSTTELQWFFNGQKKHRAYTETNKQYEKLRQHADGEMPKELIEKRRPSESEDIKKYRNEIYVPKTKSPITKVLNSLSKIRRSPDWSISYKDVFRPSNVVEAESLENYCERFYPGYESVTNWMFSVYLKNQCIDPNAVIAVFPQKADIKDNEFYKPMAMLVNSDNVLYYEEDDDWAVIQSTEMSDVKGEDGLIQYQLGKVFYIFTTEIVARYDQVSTTSDYQRTMEIKHDFGRIPVFKVPAQFLKQKDNTMIQESRISPMVPHLDEAAREYSDLQAAKVQHMYPFMWYIDNKECNHCGGTGKVLNQNAPSEGQKACTHCSGKGKVKFSPYSMIAVDGPKLGQSSVPIPPAGYINRDIEIIKHQEESNRVHLYEALCAINMQFLDQTPLNISGEAKQVDREELNNFVYSVAEDLVRAMDRIYYWINEWRYSFAVADPEKRRRMLPSIAVPQNYDLLPADYLIDEIGKLKTNKANPILISAIEHDYAVKKCYNNPEIAQLTSLLFELDPLPALNEDEKMTRLSNKGVSQEDYIISCNIVSFLQQALAENKRFGEMKYADKMQKMKDLAKKKLEEISLVGQVRQEVAPANQPPGN